MVFSFVSVAGRVGQIALREFCAIVRERNREKEREILESLLFCFWAAGREVDSEFLNVSLLFLLTKDQERD
jgi:hypothetical protein